MVVVGMAADTELDCPAGMGEIIRDIGPGFRVTAGHSGIVGVKHTENRPDESLEILLDRTVGPESGGTPDMAGDDGVPAFRQRAEAFDGETDRIGELVPEHTEIVSARVQADDPCFRLRIVVIVIERASADNIRDMALKPGIDLFVGKVALRYAGLPV